MTILLTHHHPADSSYASIVVWTIGAIVFLAIAISEIKAHGNKNNIF